MANDNFTSPEKFQDFISSKTSKFACEICGNENWSIGTLPHNSVPALIVQKANVGGIRGSIQLIICECTKCGNLKSFREDFIREALASDTGEGERL